MKKILIYRPGALGDTIVAVPTIQAIRRTYPQAALALMSIRMDTGIWADQVLREFGWFDELITYAPGGMRKPGAVGALCRRVRQFGADMVLHLSSEQNSPARLLRDRAFFALAGIPRFVGGAPASVTWYGRRRTDDRLYPLEVDRLLAFAVEAGAAPDRPPVFDLPISDAARARVDAVLDDPAFEKGRMLIGLCPGSKQPAKRWPVERYGQVGRRLIDAYDASIVVVGGEQERVAGAQIGSAWPRGRWLNTAGRLSVLEMAELLRRCVCYLGNDTGAMHVAAAVGTRCVGVFGAQYPEHSWHPYGDDHVVIRRRPPCRNCFLTECTRHATRCLTEISTDEVWAACARLLVYH
ncbi:MAG: glycosyltransferase family 9 protein [Acidobacteriota bacterium]